MWYCGIVLLPESGVYLPRGSRLLPKSFLGKDNCVLGSTFTAGGKRSLAGWYV